MPEVVRRRVIESPPTPEKSYQEAEESLVKFIEKQVELMNSHLLFGGEDTPSFYALNKSLMEHESVAIMLTSMYANAKFQSQIAQEKYDDFYAEKYADAKAQQVSLGKSAQYTAAREIEMYVRKTWIIELSKLKAEYLKLEAQRSFLERLTKNWEAYQWTLSTLSKNSQIEAQAAVGAQQHKYEFGDEDSQQ